MSGPGTAILILILVLGILALTSGTIVISRRRARGPEAPEDHPPAQILVEEPPEAEPPAPDAPAPDAPAPDAPAPDAPAPDAPAPDAPAPDRVVVEPVAVVSEPVAPGRGRVRSIGSSLARLFRGSALTDQDWEDLEEVLLRADVGVVATGHIVTALRARKDVTDGLASLKEELLAVLGTPDRSMHRRAEGLSVWLVTGVNGVGKTTTIGKLASQLRSEGASVVLAAADTFRAAADQQLEQWATRAGAEIVKLAPGADPAAVVFDGVAAARSQGADVLIVDTAGRLQNKRNLMEELEKIHRVLEREAGPPDEVLLVLDATTGQNGIQQARAFAEAASVTGIALTKLDGSAKGGIVVAIQQELGIPVKLVGLGEGIDDLAPFVAAEFVDDLLRA